MTALAGAWPLTRLALRRDRIMVAAWIYALAAVCYVSVDATRKLYPTPASRIAFAAGAGANQATVAMYGPAGDLRTLGGLATWKLNALGAVLAAIMSMIIVVRHTRGEEDAGRLDLVGATAVGRLAPLSAALLTAFLANLGVAALVAAGLAVAGLPTVASAGFGLALAAAGCVFAALAACAAQLAASARTATGLVTGALGLAYLMRAAGDTAPAGSGLAALSWLSPVGWTEQVRPFGPLRWWVLAVAASFALAVTAAAYLLARLRDAGAGLMPAPASRAAAGAGLRGPAGLAWRLQRGPLLAWAAGFAVYGLFTGALADGVGSLVGDSASVRDLFSRLGGHAGLVNGYLAATMTFMGLLASAYAVQAAARLRAEESGQRAEPVLATATGRLRWALGHLAFAAVGPAALLAVTGLAAGLAYGARAGDPGTALPRLLAAALVQVPAVWVAAGLAMAVFGLAPRLTGLAWAALVAFLLIGEIGPLAGLSRWAMDLSPFTHVPRLPGAAFSVMPLAWLTLAAALATVAGLAGLRRRDLG